MIRKGKNAPSQFLAVLAAKVVDNVQYCTRPTRAVPVRFQAFSDTCALSEFLWRHVSRETKCDLCLKPFCHDDSYKMNFSVVIDAEHNINFLHTSCANGHNRVLIEGYSFSDTMHSLSIPWRGLVERAVIGDTAGLEHADSLQLLQAQIRTQDLAELEAELAIRREARAASVIQ